MTLDGWRARNGLWWRVVREVLAVGIPATAVLFAWEGLGYASVSGLFGCAILPLRHRWPRVAVVLCLPALGGGLGWPSAIVALFALGRSRPLVRPLAVWILIASASALVPVLIEEALPIQDAILAGSFVLLASGAPVALGALVTTRQQLTASLHRLRAATEAEASAKAETARAEERARMTREIHDAVGHHVTLIAMEASVLATTSDEPAVIESAGRLRGLARAALDEMRTTLGLAAEQQSVASLHTIPDLVARARESGLDVELVDETDGHGDVAPGLGRAVYRVVQEALTNVSKHAPGAGVTVRLAEDDGDLKISVVNGAPKGRVIDLGHGASGLEGLAERVRTAGGRLQAGSSADGGFELTAVLPR